MAIRNIFRGVAACLTILLPLGTTASAFSDVTWTGLGANDSWSTTQNWNPQVPPGTLDSVFFTDIGASNTAGVTTNFLPASQTVANLSYANDANYHTTDLQGFQLTITDTLQVNTNKNGGTQTTIKNGAIQLGSALQPGNLYVARNLQSVNNASFGTLDLSSTTFDATLSTLIAGQKSLGMGGSGSAILLGGKAGNIVVGSEANPGAIYIGRTDISGSSSGLVDFTNQTSFTAKVGNLWLGTADGGTALGTLNLTANNHIDAASIRVGNSNQSDNFNGTSILRLGANNVITTDELIVGGRRSNGSLEITSGGVLQLGTELKPTNFIIGRHDQPSNVDQTATVNLQGATFNAVLSQLVLAEKTGNGGGGTNDTFTGGNQGDIVIGSPEQLGNFIVGRNTQSSSVLGQLDWGSQTSLVANVDQFQIGNATNGFARGVVILPQSNVINANAIIIGQSLSADNYGAQSSLQLGLHNEISTSQLLVGGARSNANLKIAVGGTLDLGTAARPTSLVVGRNDADTGNNFIQSGLADLHGTTFNAVLSELVVGEKSAGLNGNAIGTLLGGTAGSIAIGSKAAPGNFFVGHSVQGLLAIGTVDFGGQDSLTATLDQFQIGSAAAGTARGAVVLAKSNTIDANAIIVGQSAVSDNYGTPSTLHLGLQNDISTSEFLVGGRRTNGQVDIDVGSKLNLGTVAKPTSLVVGRNDADTGNNNGHLGSVDLHGAAFNAILSELVVGEKSLGNNGNAGGTLIGGSSGAIVIGSKASPGNVYIGHSIQGNVAIGSADFGGQDSLTASLDQLQIGTAAVGISRGSLVLAKSNTIEANSIIVGKSLTGDSYGFPSSLHLGQQNDIQASQLLVGGRRANGSVDITAGGSLNLGSVAAPTSLVIGRNDADTGGTQTAVVDLRNSTFNAHLSELIVGEKSAGPNGNTSATFFGGSSGSISIGSPSARGNFAVSNTISGNGSQGLVDLGGQTQLTAYLDRFSIATATNRVSNGQVTLATNNFIDANSITVGDGGSSTLKLGLSNTLLVDEFKVGMNYSIGTVQIPSGGTLNLGSPERPTQLTIGSGQTNTNEIYWGSVDLTNATVHAYLGTVIIGQKDNLPGRQQGTLTISNHADNTIVADSIFLAGLNSDGRLNFGGGTLSTHSISKGEGSAVFNWQGGTLSLDNFGTPAKTFNLDNTNFGTLAAGYSSNLTNIFGQYNQGALATLAIDEHAGLFDRLAVSQSTSLNGTLDLNLTPGFSPGVGSTFTILNASSVTGVFSHVTGYYAGGDSFLYPVYHSNFVELKAYLAGDSNFDGKVDGADYTAWADHFLLPGDGVASGDFNGDGLVDGLDYVIWADHFTVVPPSPSLTAVPEPSSLLLAAIGAAGLAIRQLRKTRNSHAS